MLAAIYLSTSAQPISLRRLVALFVVVFAVMDSVSVAFGVKNPFHTALIVVAALTLAAWSAPLARLSYDALCRRSFRPTMLLGVSGFIRWTYCLLVVFPLTMAICFAISPSHHLTVGGLLRPTILAAGIALWFAAQGWPLHVFHHIHETYGVKRREQTLLVNGSTRELSYRPVSKSIVGNMIDGAVVVE
jgi:hypothetical protein